MNKPTPGPWEQFGYSIVGAKGTDQGRVVLLMAHGSMSPAPPFDCLNAKHREAIDTVSANAALIVSAVNACFAVNPDNPQAVAEAFGEIVRTLREIRLLYAAYENDGRGRCEAMGKLACAALAALEAKP